MAGRSSRLDTILPDEQELLAIKLKGHTEEDVFSSVCMYRPSSENYRILHYDEDGIGNGCEKYSTLQYHEDGLQERREW